jgi:hypothetical protein
MGWKSTYTGRTKDQFQEIHIALYREAHGNWASMKSGAIQIIRPRRPLAKFDVIKFEHSCKNNSTVLLTVEEIYCGT